MAKRKFDESKVTRDASGRFSRSGSIGPKIADGSFAQRYRQLGTQTTRRANGSRNITSYGPLKNGTSNLNVKPQSSRPRQRNSTTAGSANMRSMSSGQTAERLRRLREGHGRRGVR